MTADNGVAIGASSNAGSGVAIGLSAYGYQRGVAIGENAIAGSHTVAIGENASQLSGAIVQQRGAVILGSDAKVMSTNGAIAIGSQAYASGIEAIAIGGTFNIKNGAASADNDYAIQLGSGKNTEVSSFQIFNWKLLDSNGNVPEARVSAIGYAKERIIPALSVSYINDASGGTDVSGALNQLFEEALWIDSSSQNLMEDDSPVLSLNINGKQIATTDQFAKFVDLTSNQQISGLKGFSNKVTFDSQVDFSGQVGVFNTDLYVANENADTEIDIYPEDITFFRDSTGLGTLSSNDSVGLVFQNTGFTPFAFPAEEGQQKPGLSAFRVIATEKYADQTRCVLPIVSSSDSTLQLSGTSYVYRIADSGNTGAFPTLSAPTDIVQNGNYYYSFEIEWTTAATVGSYSGGYDWITYPEFAGDGNTYTYYIAGRWDSTANTYTLNCWRAKQIA